MPQLVITVGLSRYGHKNLFFSHIKFILVFFNYEMKMVEEKAYPIELSFISENLHHRKFAKFAIRI